MDPPTERLAESQTGEETQYIADRKAEPGHLSSVRTGWRDIGAMAMRQRAHCAARTKSPA
jgi:hypothetical protein